MRSMPRRSSSSTRWPTSAVACCGGPCTRSRGGGAGPGIGDWRHFRAQAAIARGVAGLSHRARSCVIPMTDMEARDLFEAHGAAIYRFAAVLLRHPQDAEDCVQETFLRLLRHLEAGGDTSNIRGWLFTVAANAARDRQGRRLRWIPWLPAHDRAVAPAALPDEDGRLARSEEN